MLTADTITDEQIHALRGHAEARLAASDFGHGDEDTIVACDRALYLDLMEEEEEDERQALIETSRARCAEILNARGSCPPVISSAKTTPCAYCGRPRWIERDPLKIPGYHIRFRGPRRCRCKDSA